jgi:hypothetical protein
MTSLERQVLVVARSYVGVREQGGQNCGPEVARFQATCGCKPGDRWCACFACTVIAEAASVAGVTPAFQPSGNSMHLLTLNRSLRIDEDKARELLGQFIPLVGIINHGNGKGHTIFAIGIAHNLLITIEGNTGAGPSAPHRDRDGDGVYTRNDRSLASISGGWLRIA